MKSTQNQLKMDSAIKRIDKSICQIKKNQQIEKDRCQSLENEWAELTLMDWS